MSARRDGLRSLAGLIALVGLANGAPAQTLLAASKPAAVVNGEAITQAELEAVLKERPVATATTEAQRRQMRLEALNMLIDDLLMQQYLRQHGPPIDPRKVEEKLKEVENHYKKLGKTMAQFYEETGQTENQVRINILHTLQLLQWVDTVRKGLTEAEVRRYYDANRDYFDQVAVKASHIVLRLSAATSPGEREAARAKLKALREEIVAGKIPFAEAAKKYSQCASAPDGGDIGYFPRKFVVEEPIARAAFALQVGQVSDVVESDYGLHLITVTDRKKGQPSDYNKIKEEVRELCVEEMRLTILAEQRKAAQIRINLP